jgi:hypothetical protein
MRIQLFARMQVTRHAKCQASLRNLDSDYGSSACPLISARMAVAAIYYDFLPKKVVFTNMFLWGFQPFYIGFLSVHFLHWFLAFSLFSWLS